MDKIGIEGFNYQAPGCKEITSQEKKEEDGSVQCLGSHDFMKN